MNIPVKDVLARAAEPLKSVDLKSVDLKRVDLKRVDQGQWLRTGLATTGAFVVVSVASAITSAYRRKREGG
jgi:hypothetical protein